MAPPLWRTISITICILFTVAAHASNPAAGSRPSTNPHETLAPPRATLSRPPDDLSPALMPSALSLEEDPEDALFPHTHSRLSNVLWYALGVLCCMLAADLVYALSHSVERPLRPAVAAHLPVPVSIPAFSASPMLQRPNPRPRPKPPRRKPRYRDRSRLFRQHRCNRRPPTARSTRHRTRHLPRTSSHPPASLYTISFFSTPSLPQVHSTMSPFLQPIPRINYPRRAHETHNHDDARASATTPVPTLVGRQPRPAPTDSMHHSSGDAQTAYSRTSKSLLPPHPGRGSPHRRNILLDRLDARHPGASRPLPSSSWPGADHLAKHWTTAADPPGIHGARAPKHWTTAADPPGIHGARAPILETANAAFSWGSKYPANEWTGPSAQTSTNRTSGPARAAQTSARPIMVNN
jgi:hypothetical protein